MDPDPLLDILWSQLPGCEIHEQLDLLIGQLQGHGQEEVKDSAGNSMLCSFSFRMGEEGLVTFTLLPAKSASHFHQAVQHLFSLVFSVKFFRASQAKELVSVVGRLHPCIVLGQVRQVIERGTGEAAKQHRPATLRLCLRSGKPPDLVVLE